jgi:hypothetical protein
LYKSTKKTFFQVSPEPFAVQWARSGRIFT